MTDHDTTSGERWVRPAALAGAWYESDPDDLRSDLRLYLDRAAGPLPEGRRRALIVPHAAHRYSGQAAASGYRALAGATIDRVIVLGVSHRVGFYGASVAKMSHYETPLGAIPIDAGGRDRLLAEPLFQWVPMAHDTEHSIEIQLPFLQEVLGRFRLLPILMGQLRREDAPKIADALRPLIDARTLIVASSDFTHYGPRFQYQPFRDNVVANLRRLDAGALAPALAIEPDRFADYIEATGATICGRNAVEVLLRLLPPGETAATLLSYYTSAELSRDSENSVSYATVLYTEGEPHPAAVDAATLAAPPVAPPGPRFVDEAGQRWLLAAARRTLEEAVRQAKIDFVADEDPPDLPGLRDPHGCFVTLTSGGRLRGCIGTIESTGPLFRTAMENTVKAAFHDPRFRPVQLGEPSGITIEISILGTPRRVDSPAAILPGWQGVILRKGNRRALFLPEVAPKYGWSRTETLSRLAEKAGLPADGWRQGAEFRVFESQSFLEGDLPAE